MTSKASARAPRARSACSTTPRRGPDRTTRATCSRSSPTSWTRGSGAAPRRHRVDPADRQRADRDRPGVRVRLLRYAGVPRVARRRLPSRARELEPGHDHDRPRVRRRHVRRAARRRHAHAHHRQGATRRAAPHVGRADRPQPRGRAARSRRARDVRRRNDRRRRRRDPHRRGPPPVQAGDDRDRVVGAALGYRVHSRGIAPYRRRCRLSGDHSAGVHPGRRGHRHRARPRRDGARRRARPRREHRSPRSSSSAASPGGRSTSSR